MKKFFLNLIVLGLLSSFILKTKATNLISDNEYQETTKKDNGVLTKTKENKETEEGRIVTFNLKNTNLEEEELEFKFNVIVKCLEKEFNYNNNNTITDIIKNVNISSGFNGEKTASFEVVSNEGIKQKINDFIKTNFNSKDIKEIKNSLKRIVGKNLSNIKFDDIEKNIKTKIDDKINQQKSTNLFDDAFSFFKNSQEKEIEEEVRNKMIDKLKEEKNRIEQYKNNLTSKNLDSLIDSIYSVSSNGEFKRSGYSVSQVATNVEK